jgi:hypothetical protein
VEASQPEAGAFDVSGIHALLDQAEAEFHRLFEGHSAFGHVERFVPLLNTARTILDLSAQEAPKEGQ